MRSPRRARDRRHRRQRLHQWTRPRASARGRRVVLVSSLAAFEGARSLYGRAKLELERAVLARGGVVLRPGVVFGVDAGGLFGSLARVIGRRPLVPLAGGGWQRLFVTHD